MLKMCVKPIYTNGCQGSGPSDILFSLNVLGGSLGHKYETLTGNWTKKSIFVILITSRVIIVNVSILHCKTVIKVCIFIFSLQCFGCSYNSFIIALILFCVGHQQLAPIVCCWPLKTSWILLAFSVTQASFLVLPKVHKMCTSNEREQV